MAGAKSWGRHSEIREKGRASPGTAIETVGKESVFLKNLSGCYVENGCITVNYGKRAFLLLQYD